ncbi:MAG: FIST signal transduction protein [Candidatus Binatia bacterium]
MRWSSAVSREAELDEAIDEVVEQVRGELGDDPPDLAAVFVSAHHAACYAGVARRLMAGLAPRVVIGCSAGGVIGGAREVEEAPGVSLTAARLPDVDLEPFHVANAAETSAWDQRGSLAASEQPQFLLLADPFSFDTEAFLRSLDRTFPESGKIGGLASGGRRPGENVLYLGADVHREGLVGVAMSGNLELDTIVAQGCRPLGDPMFVTRSQGNVIYALDGKSPVEVLQELYGRLDERDRELCRHSLFLGIVMKESAGVYRQGDFLIRNLVGIDPDAGTLAIGALIADGTIVQFHLRDAKTSAEDLEELLSRVDPAAEPRPQGSLLFSCLGRGKHLYGRPDHDTDAFRRHLGDVPLGGFFCNGEIGPVQGKTFLHGYTSSFGLFRPRT